MNTDVGLLLLRLVGGGVMLWAHGLPKLLNYAQYVQQFPDPLGVGASLSLGLTIFAEVVCAAFVALGLFTRLTLIPLIITMLVAAFIVHAADPFQKKEMAILFLTMYAAIFVSGPGQYSLQNMFKISAGRFNWLLK